MKKISNKEILKILNLNLGDTVLIKELNSSDFKVIEDNDGLWLVRTSTMLHIKELFYFSFEKIER